MVATNAAAVAANAAALADHGTPPDGTPGDASGPRTHGQKPCGEAADMTSWAEMTAGGDRAVTDSWEIFYAVLTWHWAC